MNRSSLVLVISFVLVVLSTNANAEFVTYSVTTSTILNNPNGTWGGNLNVGAGQNLNLTLAFAYDRFPIIRNQQWASFQLTSFQVFDNTNGLASDLFQSDTLGFGGSISTYYNVTGLLDRFTGASFGSVGGSLLLGTIGEFGDLGDPLPFGPGLDAIVNSFPIPNVVARAPDLRNDNVVGVNGTYKIDEGDFVFTSQLSSPAQVPEPDSIAIFGLSVVGLVSIVWHRRSHGRPGSPREGYRVCCPLVSAPASGLAVKS